MDRLVLAASIFTLAGALALHTTDRAVAQETIERPSDFPPTCVVIGTDVPFMGPAELFMRESKRMGAQHFIGGPAYLCAY